MLKAMSDLPPIPRRAASPSLSGAPDGTPVVEAPPIEPPSGELPVPPKSKPAANTAVASQAMPSTSGIGVLLVNLGTPEAAEPKALRRYLKELSLIHISEPTRP